MSDTPPIRLEQGTALSLLWETADDLRQSAADPVWRTFTPPRTRTR